MASFRTARTRLARSGLAATALLCACGGGTDGVPAAVPDAAAGAEAAGLDAATADAATADAADPFAGAPPAQCRTPVAWGAKAFTEVTAAVGIDPAGLAVAGFRLSTADLDGDLYPELTVRRHVAGVREVWEKGKRTFHLLKNHAGSGIWTFSDHTLASGILATRDGKGGRAAHVVLYGDVDNDGDVDVFAGAHIPADPKLDLQPGDASELLLNQGDGAFALASNATFAATDLRRPLNAASFTDYDRDGRLDLWLGYGTSLQGQPYQGQLVAGDGAGDFSIVTAAEGLATLPWGSAAAVHNGLAHRNSWGTAACDLNDDGHPDLLSVSYGRYFNGLWLGGQNQPPAGSTTQGKRFVDAHVATGFGRDDDDDWTTNVNAQCFCEEQPKAEECDKAPKPKLNCPALKQGFGGAFRWNHATDRKPYRLGGNTGTVVCADLDNDGDFDLVPMTIVHWDVGSSSDPTHIARNGGGAVPVFEHLSVKATGLARKWPDPNWNAGDMTGAAADFDNDGRLDLLVGSSDYPGTRAFLWLQQPDGTFAEVPAAKGIDHPRAHGVAVADFDRDGDLDVAMGHSRGRCKDDPTCAPTEQVRIWRNDSEPGNFVQLQLEGAAPGSNRSAIGARVKVTAGGVTQTQEVGGGHGHYGLQQDLVLHFGLGTACAVDKIEVRWPDAVGTMQIWTNVRAHQVVRLQQGVGAPMYPLVK